MDESSIDPVTLSGWYPCRDGKIRYFGWVRGHLRTMATCDDWAHVARYERESRDAFDAYVPRWYSRTK